MNPKKMIFASDSFKGSLSQEQILNILEEAAREQFPDCECIGIPIADGGEGTARAVTGAAGGKLRKVKVHDPLMKKHEAIYGLLPRHRAIIEMAEASGLPLVPASKRDPRNTSSYGTGELIMDALQQGCRDIRIAIGGSAVDDGGMGAFRAMGFQFFDKDGEELEGFGKDLIRVASISDANVPPEVRGASFTVMCDVDNPLLGPDGATYVFGPQKGGTPEILKELEAGMENYAAVVAKITGEHYENFGGTGAAGGLGFSAAAFLRAKIRSGIETILDLVGFDEMLRDTNLCITGEGRLDDQSMHGKAIHGVAKHCKKEGVPCIAIVGGTKEGYDRIYLQGVTGVYVTTPDGMPLEEAMAHAEELYRKSAEKVFDDIAKDVIHGGEY
ncbi:MAG: glycerate kinase [Acutalibacteraceae bacterium]|nr:glycerate kinase [Acutalibacteraceae bacterium]